MQIVLSCSFRVNKFVDNFILANYLSSHTILIFLFSPLNWCKYGVWVSQLFNSWSIFWRGSPNFRFAADSERVLPADRRPQSFPRYQRFQNLQSFRNFRYFQNFQLLKKLKRNLPASKCSEVSKRHSDPGLDWIDHTWKEWLAFLINGRYLIGCK